jgi:GR25 family glycosyltransferase involved in LPS biosynthesis
MDDDAVLTDNFLEVLEKAYDSLPNDWHLLYLAANHNKDSMPTANDRISDCLYKMKGSIGSHAIIINRPAFHTILNYASSPYGPLDVYLSMYQQICPCYITYPGLATQLPGRSDIIDKEVDYTKDWGVDYINHIGYLKNDVQK